MFDTSLDPSRIGRRPEWWDYSVCRPRALAFIAMPGLPSLSPHEAVQVSQSVICVYSSPSPHSWLHRIHGECLSVSKRSVNGASCCVYLCSSRTTTLKTLGNIVHSLYKCYTVGNLDDPFEFFRGNLTGAVWVGLDA